MKVELANITSDAENVIAESARVCYKSEARDESSNMKLVERLRDLGHLSTFEHAKATFKVTGISRVCSHQLVRHRHFSFSQMSQRYVDEKDFAYVTPKSIKGDEEAERLYDDFMKQAHGVYSKLVEAGVAREDARFVLPNATETEIVVTANFRALREFIKLRKTQAAQWEIRKLAREMLELLKDNAPHAFSDL